ncbi:MAG TPA: S41 family peptidase [Chromatiales bacterium]|nr:S41 family peptidase [Chromatiales bacterium]
MKHTRPCNTGYLSRAGAGLLIGVLLGVMISVGPGVFAERPEHYNVPLDALRTFSEVYVRVKKDYVKPVDDQELIEHAIRGMLSGLDPHSAYLNADEFKELQIGTSGEFGGLGIEVGMENGFVKVIAPIDDTPAQRAGIQAGDLIIRIDDKPVKGMTLNEAVKLMRGKKGTKIKLTVVREGADKPLEFTIVRDVIRVKSVKSRMLEPGFGYVRITSFQSKTTRNLIDAIKKLEKKNKGPLKGLVLDLRNNPGGVLNAAVGVADAFLDKGLIVYTEGRVADAKLRYSATQGDVLHGAPMVVLINGGSASASEIVAGALQDHQRAIIMGRRSFGKGSVQTILPLNEETAIKLTTALYFTPSGRSIQAEGIQPDIEVQNLRVAEAESAVKPLTEADLAGHLENGTEKNKDGKRTSKGKANGETEPLASRDYPLSEALNVLKAVSILQSKQKSRRLASSA